MESKKTLFSFFAIMYFFYCIFGGKTFYFIDFINLVIHEAGHVLFFFGGQFLTVAGGSLLQIAIPSLFALYFFNSGEYWSGSIILFWAGENFLNVSIYMKDAISMSLPLLGGDGVIHDWNWIFTDLGVLNQAPKIGAITFGIGVCIIFLAAFLSLAFSIQKRPKYDF